VVAEEVGESYGEEHGEEGGVDRGGLYAGDLWWGVSGKRREGGGGEGTYVEGEGEEAD
jgi:hypothetical protein